MKKNLLVAIADGHYIDQAKQLFSSVYFNAGWKGDYMLMALNVPEKELAWFTEKGIIVKKCSPIHDGKKSGIDYPPIDPTLSEEQQFHMNLFKNTPVILNKFELFTPEFKKWDTVLYLDCDIIVRHSLDALTTVQGLWAVIDTPSPRLKNQFLHNTPNDKLIHFLNATFDMDAPAFNSGVMAFSTDIIMDNSFEELCRLFHTYYLICNLYGEQPILNLYFNKRWNKLHFSYNLYVLLWIRWYRFRPQKIDGTILHIYGREKPWRPESPFYVEWKTNLEKADHMDVYTRTVVARFPMHVPVAIKIAQSLYLAVVMRISFIYRIVTRFSKW